MLPDGDGLVKGCIAFVIILLITGAVLGIALWHLFGWLYEHIQIV